jgi:uncharacterized protein YaaW (UPF0174 family)
MAKHDELDTLLHKLTNDDWNELEKILGTKELLKKYDADRIKFANQEIRHNYGHTVLNLFRDSYEPDYKDILYGVCEKLDIKPKSHHTVTETEDKLIVEVIDRAKEQIIKEKGIAAWNEIERDAQKEIDKMLANGDLPSNVAIALKDLRGPAIMAALYAGKLAGFVLYQVATQVFFQIAKFLGLRIGVTLAGPLIGGVLSFLLGPAGWLLAGITLLYDLGNTNWKKTIPTVITISFLRRKYEFI